MSEIKVKNDSSDNTKSTKHQPKKKENGYLTVVNLFRMGLKLHELLQFLIRVSIQFCF